jgi:hypothetical protein
MVISPRVVPVEKAPLKGKRQGREVSQVNRQRLLHDADRVQRHLVDLRWWEPPALTPQEQNWLAQARLANKRADMIDLQKVFLVVKVVAIVAVALVLVMGGLHQLLR